MKALAAALATLSLLGASCSAEAEHAAPPAPASSAPAAGSPSPSPAAPPPLSWQACKEGFECAELEVPLTGDDLAGGTVGLALTRRPAEGPGERIGSLVVNPGGPGASAVGYLQSAWSLVPDAVRARFDLVAFDPRGVGRTAPVRCGTTEELDRYFALDPSPDDAEELAALEDSNAVLLAECQRRSGDLLPHVSTADAAADLDRVREAVGDERLTYLGYSYGTSLGAAYLDRFPTRARAMVLDAGLDPTLTWDALLEGQSKGFDRALEALLADCERTRCAFRRAVDGPLLAAYDRLAARVDAAPLPGDGDRVVGPGNFTLGVLAGLYSRANGWPAVASALAAAERGDGAELLALSDSYLERDFDGYSNAGEANLAVNCIDRPWPRDSAPYLALADRVAVEAPRFGPFSALSGLACAGWPAPVVGEPGPVSGEGAPPVVVIGTTGDPATPYAWSVALADQLASGVLLTYRGDGHTVYRTGAPACIRRPVDAYLLTGQAPEPTTC